MGYAHIIVHNDLREGLKREQQWANQIMFVRERSFSEAPHIALVSSPHLAHGYNGQQAIVVEGDSVRFNPDRDT
jgi:hypothetical protein